MFFSLFRWFFVLGGGEKAVQLPRAILYWVVVKSKIHEKMIKKTKFIKIKNFVCKEVYEHTLYEIWVSGSVQNSRSRVHKFLYTILQFETVWLLGYNGKVWFRARKSPKFRFYLPSLTRSFSKLRRSWVKNLGTLNIYCSRNVHFRGLLSSNSSGAWRYTSLKLREFPRFHLWLP